MWETIGIQFLGIGLLFYGLMYFVSTSIAASSQKIDLPTWVAIIRTAIGSGLILGGLKLLGVM